MISPGCVIAVSAPFDFCNTIHNFFIFPSSGTTETLNLTAAQYLHEASYLSAEAQESTTTALITTENKLATEADDALKAMESMQPLHELVLPIFQKVGNGLAKMGKIVGSSTKPREITPGALATFIATKQKCEKDVMLPLQELIDLTLSREKYLQDMYASQLAQIDHIKTMIQTLKDRMKLTSEQKKTTEIWKEFWK